ncbi:TrmH family RNA methyltransferase [Kineosphaera limosa]|uniref:Putative RNA methyltransferase n=1 Tax=Kineosphaera limosa NBRC 100340 TaxID=1184609 RepID=K6WX77_9MICO|nr:RNA methyltransferase [Kineosphaera limosa]NYE01540.1 TrmH family RNA methyltransferase [Kineosphaera limosa]GAB96697.1 putative RNA methyltransferase [Kineosphaera limosa NBRC 100340]
MADLHITSAANPRVKTLVGLRRRRARSDAGLTLVEGLEETLLATTAGARLRELYYCPELFGAGAHELVPQLREGVGHVVRLSRPVFEKVAYREGPDGILAVADSVAADLAALRLPQSPLLLLAEAVEKPGNLGAMLRTADGAGVDAVLAADPVTDWSNPNLVRASKGTVFSVPVAADSTQAVLAWLAEHGIALVATTPDTDLHYADVDYTGPVAIAVGAEKTGLTDAALAAATYRVRIPMAGRADSLNVATSAAIVAYEAVRQRR